MGVRAEIINYDLKGFLRSQTFYRIRAKSRDLFQNLKSYGQSLFNGSNVPIDICRNLRYSLLIFHWQVCMRRSPGNPVATGQGLNINAALRLTSSVIAHHTSIAKIRPLGTQKKHVCIP